MKSNVFTIMKKEFARFFKDRRMVFTALIMPGLLLFLTYTLMGGLMTSLSGGDQGAFIAHVCNLPDSLADRLADEEGLQVEIIEEGQIGRLRAQIEAGEENLLLVFPQGFDQQVAAYDAQSGLAAPRIDIYYNSSSAVSSMGYDNARAFLDGYQYDLCHKFEVAQQDLIPPNAPDYTMNALTGMLPMLLLMFIFSGCITLAPESIAGEKERGTIATLLVTPIKSGELAAGKILSLGVMALLCGLSSTLGAILGFDNMISGTGANFSFDGIGATEYLLLLLVILSSVLLTSTLISLISAYAKSVKEANTTAMPLLIVTLVIGLLPMIGGGGDNFYFYLIPIYNTSLGMSGLFASDYSAANIMISVVSNILYACAGSYVLAKMFRSEKIIMTK
ncbi:MAG: ABC transporter permease subunit [Oscillospiraceae bacterium]|nr:ABC transporter permease subunit [Oscillospiraceae bacterium]